MDLGLRGKHALVCGASKGLGLACADALAAEGVDVVIVARGAEALEKAAADLRARHGRRVIAVATDITTPEGRKAALDAAARLGNLDILVNNAGGPPPGNFRDWERSDWLAALDANMLTPIELIKATVDGMIARKWGRIINITSGAVKAPIDVLGLSNGARWSGTGAVAMTRTMRRGYFGVDQQVRYSPYAHFRVIPIPSEESAELADVAAPDSALAVTGRAASCLALSRGRRIVNVDPRPSPSLDASTEPP